MIKAISNAQLANVVGGVLPWYHANEQEPVSHRPFLEPEDSPPSNKPWFQDLSVSCTLWSGCKPRK